MEKFTIHRGLSELKLIDSKIEKQLETFVPVAFYQKDKPINGYLKHDDFKSDVQSKYDSINALFDRRISIKKAIVDSNSKTMITVAGKSMTVADAITYKAFIAQRKRINEIIKSRFDQNVALMNRNNDAVEKNLEAILQATFGKDNVKVSKDDIDSVSKPYKEANTFHLFDPLSIEGKIKDSNDFIDSFESEVDSVLSESNAITFITI